jgi:DNA-binding MarR family transcriptional regulator
MGLSSFASTLQALVKFQHKISDNRLLGIDGLSAFDSLAICLLAEEGSMSKHDLVRQLGAGKGQLKRSVANLEKKEFVLVAPGKDPDGELVSLTEKGRTFHKMLESKWRDWIKGTPDGRSLLLSVRSAVRKIQASFPRLPSSGVT